MTRFFLFLFRLVALTLSYALSTFVAAGFLTFVLFLGSDASWLKEDAGVVAGAATFLAFMWLTITQLAFLPAVICFTVLEFGRLSSLLPNLVGGGICAIATMLLLPEGNTENALPYDAGEIWIAVVAAGFVGGFSHWLLAGFRAGRWLGPANPNAPLESGR